MQKLGAVVQKGLGAGACADESAVYDKYTDHSHMTRNPGTQLDDLAGIHHVRLLVIFVLDVVIGSPVAFVDGSSGPGPALDPLTAVAAVYHVCRRP